ncbi:MAG: mannose-1-phosphate guanylyltransferase [Pseudomonadota bacterium]
MKTEHLHAIIMAGGKENRFWPLAGNNVHGQPPAVLGPAPMLEAALDRVRPLVPARRTLIVADSGFPAERPGKAGELPPENILIEPLGRGTAACIGLAAHAVLGKDPQAVMLVLPADQVITRQEEFLSLARAGTVLAESERGLVALGIVPTGPETGFGYIQAGAPGPEALGRQARPALRFHEKPDAETAASYLAAGGFFWNSGIFIWRADAILDRIGKFLPDLARGLDLIAPHLGRSTQDRILAEVYPGLPFESIDRGVLEKADDLLVLPADIGWSDIGSWSAVSAHWPVSGSNAVRGQALLLDSSGTIVHSPDKMAVLIGVRDLIVIDGPGALLICPRDREKDIRSALGELKKIGRDDLL